MLGIGACFNAMITMMPGALRAAAGDDTPDKFDKAGKLIKATPGGFSKLVDYIDAIASYAIPVGSALAVLGLVYGGCLLMVGAPHAGRTLGYVVIGIVIVLSSQGLAA
jgi:hypothetical protein